MTELLKDILKKQKVLRNINNMLYWDEVVDERVRKHARAVKLQQKILYVTVDNSTWAQELHFYKKELIDKMNAKAGYKAIIEIRYKVGGIEE